jgi:ketosteroid isomerase-like protein
MTSSAVTVVVEALRQFEKRDADGIVERFAPDGTFIDPHYPPPIGPEITGREAIRGALSFVFTLVQQPGFTVRHAFSSADHPEVASVEVDTHHTFADGTTVDFPQVFVAEIDSDGLLRRLQSYLPYPPPAAG